MWFCVECQLWYHLECCQTKHSTRSYGSLDDFLSLPLLRGGCLGVEGTAPLVCAAAKATQKLQEDGMGQTSNPTVHEALSLMHRFLLNSPAEIWAAMQDSLPAVFDSDIECPKCRRDGLRVETLTTV
jgi:hypothetical protein